MITGNIITDFSLLILFLPLAAFAINIFFGKRLPRQGDWVSIGAVLITLVLSLAMLLNMFMNWDPDFTHEAKFTWMDLGAFKIELGFWVDNITIVMLVVVSLISSMTHIFSVEYLKGDIRYSRYYAYLGLFTFSMNGIVLANNLISLYIFWELVGVSSYLLIAHWFEKPSAAAAGKKAFLTNRVGDIGFFIGIMIMFTAIGSFNIQEVFTGVSQGLIGGSLLTLAGIGLFMGAVGKSSQFPLHIWLPDAMEGPTPVSALMHAATMVAAGVYLTVRLFPLFSPDALLVIAYVGGFTALFAASIAITQNDIKKVLAYSTVSQLGYMILAVGVGNYIAAFFHLMTHAMFKACLFYGSGSVIHAMHHSLHELDDHDTDPQDMRNMGGFKSKMPITYWTMTIATLAISGVPFFSGFLSKDAILAGSLGFAQHYPQHFLLPVFGFGAAAITAFYMFRLIFMTFHGESKMPKVFKGIHESPRVMTFPLMLLSGLSIFIFYTLPYFNPLSDHGWFTELIRAGDSVVPGNPTAHEIGEGVHHAHYTAMALSLLVAGLGIGLSYLMYIKKKLSAEAWAKKMGFMYKLSFNKYYFDENYGRFLYQPFQKLSEAVAYVDWDLYDKYFINGFGRVTKWLSFLTGRVDYDGLDQSIVDGIGRSAQGFGKQLKQVQTGRLQNYMLFALVGVIIILVIQTI
ncbi:MAG: NADH-quinone oxidoreductase subunit L [Candidatus Marinimicrobia bacterium]|nr:NADH-quinone oxidoreductase subunit L [Candidatus Neomarinimicrobiota bacterium]MBL7009978.1 NADH-quinone oxidoreductase subunit L [Candidatus Neomarinimicrobiota bacterium]MBL7029688.1 NADH-quinone oxidoreductase subunit L [Candidatus Neomarinimicrobiota bacterium]